MKNPFASLCALSTLLFASSSWTAEPALVNPGFEESIDRPTGWRYSQHAGAVAFEMGLDDKVLSEGKRSFRMKRNAEQVYGLVEQMVPAPDSGGKTLRLAAMLRTEGVGPKGWMLVVNFLGETGGILGQVRSEPLTGNTEWRRATLEKPIPAATVRLSIGAMLLDGGTGWVDDVTFSVGND